MSEQRACPGAIGFTQGRGLFGTATGERAEEHGRAEQHQHQVHRADAPAAGVAIPVDLDQPVGHCERRETLDQRVAVLPMDGAAITLQQPRLGKQAKNRSSHNNYLTLPVLFCMMSNHYAFTYSHPQAWAVLSLILPALSLSLSEIAILARVTRSAMLDTLREDYVRTARAKGAPESTVLFRHALRNALIPVTTVAGLIAGFLIAGAVIIESVFRLPGVGQLVYDSINNRDLVVIKNVVVLFTILVLVVNLLVDLAYALLDPRPRAGA